MTESELLQILARGEDSCHQFKRDLADPDGVAAELAALAAGKCRNPRTTAGAASKMNLGSQAPHDQRCCILQNAASC